jgi:hypothetical protein
MKVYTIEMLSQLIHKTPASIRSDRVRNPNSLPPSFTLPGSRRVLFRNVESWFDKLIQEQTINSPQLVKSDQSVTRGRPTIKSKLKNTL